MRTCHHCHAEMIDLMLSVELNRWGICVRENENTKNLGQVKCAVCPTCGEISLYLSDLTKIKRYVEGKK